MLGASTATLTTTATWCGATRSTRQWPRSPGFNLPSPVTAANVLAWVKKQTPVTIQLYDGRKAYTQRGPLPAGYADADRITVRVMWEVGFASSHWPTRYLWPMVNMAGPFRIVKDAPEAGAGLLVLSTGDAGNRKSQYVVDPERDYLCMKWTSWEKRAGAWEKTVEHELLAVERLPGGRWYATRRCMKSYGDPERGTEPSEKTWNINVEVLTETDVPPDMFDGEKLLDAAKRQGATIESF